MHFISLNSLCILSNRCFCMAGIKSLNVLKTLNGQQSEISNNRGLKQNHLNLDIHDSCLFCLNDS